MTTMKNIAKSLAATCTRIVHVVALALITAEVAFAQDPAPSKDKSGWVMGYALVVLAIGLGLMVVCRPGTRTSDIKIVDDDD